MHRHIHQEEVYSVVSGVAEVAVGGNIGRTVTLRAGDYMRVAPAEPRALRALPAGPQNPDGEDLRVLIAGGSTLGGPFPHDSRSRVLLDDRLSLFAKLPPWVPEGSAEAAAASALNAAQELRENEHTMRLRWRLAERNALNEAAHARRVAAKAHQPAGVFTILVSAVALLDDAGRVLLARRPLGKAHAGKCEYPGGKVEAGESPQAGLRRELAEELDITVLPEDMFPLAFSSEGSAKSHLVLMLFGARRWKGTPRGAEGQPVRWVTTEELGLLSWAKHDKSALVAEPRETQLRWRTEYEWNALTDQKAHLGSRDTTELTAFRKYRFLFASYAVHAWYWEAVALFHKLFLTSLISFVVPHTATQVIVACMFSFGMVLFTMQVKPYREAANNQLATLSQVNLFLFLFTGLLLQTNPDGIGENRLVFAIVVGMLTTSIVAFSFLLFLRELWRQLLNALFDLQDEQGDEQAAAAADPEGGSSDDGSVHQHWDDGDARNHSAPPSPWVLEDAPMSGGGEANGQLEAEPHAANGGRAELPDGTPPPPSWVSRLAAPREASA